MVNLGSLPRILADRGRTSGPPSVPKGPEMIGGGGGGTKKPLPAYLRDLTAEAATLPIIIGRCTETTNLIEKLSAPGKNSCMVVGPAGTGKTTVVRGLARLALEDESVPEVLRNRRFFELNLSKFIAQGGANPASLGEAMDELITHVRENNAILVIDETCSVNQIPVIGDFFWNALKDALAETSAGKKITIVGTTTDEQYTKYIEDDKSGLKRRLPKVSFEALSPEDTLLFLTDYREKWQKKAGIRISQQAIKKLVELAKKHISGSFPDKAITIMDATASRLKDAYARRTRKLNDIRVRLEVLVRSAIATTEKEDRDIAIDSIREALKDYEQVVTRWEKVNPEVITPGVIAETISQKSGVPLTDLQESDRERLLKIEEILGQRVIGQKSAKKAVADAVRRSRSGFRDETRPPGAFMFLGPTGVGKTELAKQLAAFLFGSSDRLVRLDMSEYQQQHDAKKLTGAPPSYIGHGEPTPFEAIRLNPYSVLLFDEIEKAHPDVFDLLLQIFDNGEITDSMGRKISFKQCYIVLTSNLGAGKPPEEVREVVKKYFRPEFLGRIGEENQIIFDSLTPQDLREMVDIHTRAVKSQVKYKGYALEITEEAKDIIARQGVHPLYGARPLKRAIARLVEDQLANLFITGQYADEMKKELSPGDTIRVEVRKRKGREDIILVKGQPKPPAPTIVLSAEMEKVCAQLIKSIKKEKEVSDDDLIELMPELRRQKLKEPEKSQAEIEEPAVSPVSAPSPKQPPAPAPEQIAPSKITPSAREEKAPQEQKTNEAMAAVNRLLSIYTSLYRGKTSNLLAGCVDSSMFTPKVFSALVDAGYIIVESSNTRKSRRDIIKGNISPSFIREGKDRFVQGMSNYLRGVSNIEDLYIFMMKAVACKILDDEIDLYYQQARLKCTDLAELISPQINKALDTDDSFVKAAKAGEFFRATVGNIIENMSEREWDSSTFFTEKIEVIRERVEYVYSQERSRSGE